MSDSQESQYRGDFGAESLHFPSNSVDAQRQNTVEHIEVSSENRDANDNNVEEGEDVVMEEDPKPPVKKRKMRLRSKVWIHFDTYDCKIEKVRMARCKYCKRELKANSKQGTSSLKSHYLSCKERVHDPNVDNNQTKLAFEKNVEGEKTGNLTTWVFNQKKIADAMAEMLIIDELPFSTVEHLGFKRFVTAACPNFEIPSRRTVTRDIYDIYAREKDNLKTLIKENAQRVCITTDTWTSIQQVNYMCLTVHFIDDNWSLHKRILNFCPITGHKSEDIGRGVERCLLDWGIEKVFTVTVDNASANDGAVVYLIKKFENWGHNILCGKYVHMRCVAHIINLIVQDGLKGKDEEGSISRVRGAIRYIKNSPARYKRFKECADSAKLDTKKLLCLDVPTRWNSTYLMLEAALYLRKAFDEYEDTEAAYTTDLSKKPYYGVPIDYDWKRISLLLKFLKHFYLLTLRISGSLHVTSNLVFREISEVNLFLQDLIKSDDFELSVMAIKMKEKYEKYWESLDKMNMVIYYAAILDPHQKLEFIEFTFAMMYDAEKTASMSEMVRSGLTAMFDDYKLRFGHLLQGSSRSSSSYSHVSASSSSPVETSKRFDVHGDHTQVTRKISLQQEFRMFKNGGKREHVKSELEKYLGEDVEESDGRKFDVLNWWKVNSLRFPILSKMARDVFAVPVSTVASESTFSTGGRVLDQFRSSLTPKIVQAIICGQDWIRKNSKPIELEEDLREVELLEKEFAKLGVDSSIIDI